MEKESCPGPITHQEYTDLHNIISLITHELLGDLSSSANIDSVYEPFQPVIRQILAAATHFFDDNGATGLLEKAHALIESGKLDPSRVARAPSAQQVLQAVMDEAAKFPVFGTHQADWERMGPPVQAVIADAMDCAYKQALSAPPTIGSVFQRPSQDPPAEIVTPAHRSPE